MNGEALKEQEIEVVETAEDGTITVRKEKVKVTPQEVLRRMLSDSQYDAVRQVLAESDEGVFAEYDCPAVDETTTDGELFELVDELELESPTAGPFEKGVAALLTDEFSLRSGFSEELDVEALKWEDKIAPM